MATSALGTVLPKPPTFQTRPLPFQRMNEQDVREAVVGPLLHALGYADGTEFDITREQPLRYPRQFLGRKKPSKDPLLRGRADYILHVKGRVRWVLEVKQPSEPLDAEAAEQAYTYAAHPEVRAVYFALCNGPELTVSAVSSGPEVAPIIRLRYEEIASRFEALLDVLGPYAIEREFPDLGNLSIPPIGPGLRPMARVLSGLLEYNRATLPASPLMQLRVFIVGGFAQRNESGKVIAYLETESPVKDLQELGERFGLHTLELTSEQGCLSTDPDHPTVFEYSKDITLPANTEILDLSTWKRVRLPCTVCAKTEVSAAGVLNGNAFQGVFRTFLTISRGFRSATLEGRFTVRLG